MQINKPRVIKKWSYANMVTPLNSGFVPNGYGRQYAIQDNHPLLKIAFSEFKLNPVCVEPIYKVFTGKQNLDGAFVHLHKDSTKNGFVHVRCNLMIKKPPEGGDPVIDDIKLNIEENDLWLCIASEENHCSTPIKGGERIVVSFGGLVSYNQFEQILL